jgi:hypothetical protein
VREHQRQTDDDADDDARERVPHGANTIHAAPSSAIKT